MEDMEVMWVINGMLLTQLQKKLDQMHALPPDGNGRYFACVSYRL